MGALAALLLSVSCGNAPTAPSGPAPPLEVPSLLPVTAVLFYSTAIVGGEDATGEVWIGGNAPVGGSRVSLTTDNPSVTVSPRLIVEAERSRTAFTITTAPVTNEMTVTITATGGGVAKSASLVLRPSFAKTVPLSSLHTITFAGAELGFGALVTNYRDGAFTVQPTSETWTVIGGSPDAGIGFRNPDTDTTTVGEVRIAAGGMPFQLVSVDVTAPNGPRHVILGVTGEARVFHFEGYVQTQGAAYTTVRMTESVPAAVSTLIVRLTNTGRGTVAGIDNIVLRH